MTFGGPFQLFDYVYYFIYLTNYGLLIILGEGSIWKSHFSKNLSYQQDGLSSPFPPSNYYGSSQDLMMYS